MTDEHKKKISESCKGKTKNNGTVWVTNGNIRTRVKKEELNIYLNNGFHLGKKLSNEVITPWNKGLTKDTDYRVKKYIEHRKKH